MSLLIFNFTSSYFGSFFCLSIKAGGILKALLAEQFLLPYSILQVFMLLLALHLYPATIFLS